MFQSGIEPSDKYHPHGLFRRVKSDLSIIHSCLLVDRRFDRFQEKALRRRRARDLAGWLPAKDACADAGAPPRFSFFQGVAQDMNDSSDLIQCRRPLQITERNQELIRRAQGRAVILPIAAPIVEWP